MKRPESGSRYTAQLDAPGDAHGEAEQNAAAEQREHGLPLNARQHPGAEKAPGRAQEKEDRDAVGGRQSPPNRRSSGAASASTRRSRPRRRRRGTRRSKTPARIRSSTRGTVPLTATAARRLSRFRVSAPASARTISDDAYDAGHARTATSTTYRQPAGA